MNENTNQHLPEPVRIKVKEVAAILNIGVSTVWLYSKILPDFPKRIKERGRVFWIRDEVIAYGKNQCSFQ
ncbi:helix-turn-helix transcriptional regulator [Turicimonas sp. TL08]